MSTDIQGEGGYVRLYRSTLEWEWFKDVNTAHLWNYILMRANYKPARFKGLRIGRGQFIESIATMAENTGLTPKEVRTALNHLKRTNEVACKGTRYGTIVSVVKYSTYQQSTE